MVPDVLINPNRKESREARKSLAQIMWKKSRSGELDSVNAEHAIILFAAALNLRGLKQMESYFRMEYDLQIAEKHQLPSVSAEST